MQYIASTDILLITSFIASQNIMYLQIIYKEYILELICPSVVQNVSQLYSVLLIFPINCFEHFICWTNKFIYLYARTEWRCKFRANFLIMKEYFFPCLWLAPLYVFINNSAGISPASCRNSVKTVSSRLNLAFNSPVKCSFKL